MTATREQLVLLLTVAAELEHALACVYLFVAYSIADVEYAGQPRGARLTAWKKTIGGVGIDEMLHLAQVSNLLTAIGGVPHLRRPNFPQTGDTYALGVALTLEPFGRTTLERLARFELPVAAAAGEPVYDDGPHDGIEPSVPPFATIGELYGRIAALFRALPEKETFIGPRHAQTEGDHVSLGRDLIRVTDRATALRAIDRIIEQGEGAAADGKDGHYAKFTLILAELDDELARDASFAAGRLVAPNPVTRRRADARADGSIILDPATHRVAELANFAYEALLLVLARFFAHAGESNEELRALGDVAIKLMTSVIGPLGQLLTTLPLGDGSSRTAGMEFAVTRDTHVLPHKGPAFTVIAERLRRLEDHTRRLANEQQALLPVQRALHAIVGQFDPIAAAAY